MRRTLGLLLAVVGLAGCSVDNSPVASGNNPKEDTQQVLNTVSYYPPSPFTKFGGVFVGGIQGKAGPSHHSQDNLTGVVRIICYDDDKPCYHYYDMYGGEINVIEAGPPYLGTPDTVKAIPQM